jgi:hypothetical protein
LIVCSAKETRAPPLIVGENELKTTVMELPPATTSSTSTPRPESPRGFGAALLAMQVDPAE